jgi:carbon-monoxide dehydrogenase medium subunit
MYPFTYYRPESLNDAVSALTEPGSKLLAGGQSLLPAMKQRLAMHEQLVDISPLEELHSMTTGGHMIEIGAGVIHARVAASSEIQSTIPALSNLASQIGDPLVRNKGTLGGSIANNDPSADYPAALLALKAVIVTTEREIPADEFFLGMFETALNESEIVKAVRFAVPERAAYAKFPNPASRYAMAGAFVATYTDGVRVGVSGAGGCAFRAADYEAALNDNFSVGAVSERYLDPEELMSDLHASAAYRSQLVNVMVKRATGACLGG